jgi:TolB-like protein/DNA-binding winged helix-turn-helix (wHTH) protein/Flp pilus assembly protein TadD
MQVPATERQHALFGSFEVDFASRELRSHGRRIRLQEQPFQILAILLDQPGELVTREELQRRLWPSDTFVDFDHSINTAIKKLREALEDDALEPRFIETLPRRGYRFIASVEEEPASDAGSVPSTEGQLAVSPEDPQTRSRRRWYVLLPGAAVVVGALLLGLNVGGIRGRLWPPQTPAQGTAIPIQSLAVLPFENLSGDPSKDYFADGFTDELITDLAEQARIRVVSRSSVMRYKGSRKPLPEIARELNVDAIVEGSVSLSEQQVRITAQLIQALGDRHLWAHSYERDRKNLFSIQSEVARTIASLIRTKADGMDSADVRAASPHQRFTAATYEISLECRKLRMTGTDEGTSHAIQCYQHLLTLDPGSAATYAELAFCYLALEPSKAGAPAMKAVDLDPSLAEAHLALADFKLHYERDLTGAEREFHQALALNPSYAKAHVDRATALIASGQTADAIAEARTARDLDPFSDNIAAFSGRAFFMAGQYDKAIEEEKAALNLDPHRDRAHYWMGYSYEQKGMYTDAIAEYEKVLPNDDHSIFLLALGRSFALAGDSRKAAEVRRKIEHFSGKGFVWPYDAALFYAASGDNDRAFEWLQRDQKERDGWLLFLKVDPRLSALRSDPRFRDLLRRVGLPE